MKSTKILLMTIVLSLSLSITSCVGGNKPQTNNNNSAVTDSNSQNDQAQDKPVDIIDLTTIEKVAPAGATVNKLPLSSEVTDKSFVPENLTSLKTADLFEKFVSLGRKTAPSEINAQAGVFIKEYFERVGLEPYRDGTFYNKFYASQEIDYEDKEENIKADSLKGYIENVVGKIKGKDSSKAIVITAHFDTFLNTRGALDNASGTVTLMNIAKELTKMYKGEQPPVDIIFAAVNAEERFIVGSQYLYKDLKEIYSEFYDINMDCVGYDKFPLAYANSHDRSEPLYKAFEPYLTKYKIPYDSKSEVNIGTSDHYAFQKEGKAALDLIDYLERGRIHSKNDDTLEGVDTDEMDRLAKAVSEFIYNDNGRMY